MLPPSSCISSDWPLMMGTFIARTLKSVSTHLDAIKCAALSKYKQKCIRWIFRDADQIFCKWCISSSTSLKFQNDQTFMFTGDLCVYCIACT